MTGFRAPAARPATSSGGSDPAAARGLVFSSSAAPSVGLNYFDGRFLRADDLNLEHRAQRAYVEYSNRSGGPGICYGLELSMSGPTFALAGGLGIDQRGRLVLLPSAQSGAVSALIQDPAGSAGVVPSSSATGTGPLSGTAFAECQDEPADQAVASSGVYVVKVGRYQLLTGDAEVLGRLCDSGCVYPTDRPYVVDGVQVWAEPVGQVTLPSLPGVTDPSLHARSQVASGYFERELQHAGSLLSRRGLSLPAWCRGAAADPGSDTDTSSMGIPVGVFAWDGSQVSWYDSWTARRERIESPAQGYWAGVMELRPWSVFLAQVLQFQCQLLDVYGDVLPALAARGVVTAPDIGNAVFENSATWIDHLSTAVRNLGAAADRELSKTLDEGFGRLRALQAQVTAAGHVRAGLALSSQLLLDSGVVTLPAAGYLPSTSTTATGLVQEMQLLFGTGVDLRLCAVRRDQIAHELERSQHMNRVSLLRGLANVADVEQVDVLVPDGVLETSGEALTAHGFAVDLTIGASTVPSHSVIRISGAQDRATLLLKGAARVDGGAGISATAAVAGTDAASLMAVARPVADLLRGMANWPSVVQHLARLSVGHSPVAMHSLRTLGKAAMAATAEYRHAARKAKLASLPTDDTRAVAISASLWVAQDPFAMAASAPAAFHAELDMVVPQTATFGVSLVADGVLRVLASTTGLGVQVNALVSGLATVTGSGLPAGGQARSFERRLTLTRAGGSNESAITVRDDESNIEVAVGWQGHPIEASGAVAEASTTGSSWAPRNASVSSSRRGYGGVFPVPDKTRVVAQFQASEDPAIYQPGNDHRDAAIAAIQLLSSLHPDDASYVDVAYGQLFPKSGVSARTLVRPRWDWVLFRRRRRYECAGSTDVATLDASTVAAWVILAEDADQAEDYRARLVGGDDSIPWPNTPTELVQFEAGTSTLRSSSLAWRQRFQAAGGGDVIFFAGYAKAEASTDPPVGLPRAQALVDATDPLASLDPDGKVDLVTDPPSGQMLTETEGSIFIVTYAAQAVYPIDIIAVDGTSRQNSKLVEALDGGQDEPVDAAPAESFTRVGRSDSATFSQTDGDASSAVLTALETKLSQAANGADVERRVVVWTQVSVTGDRRTELDDRVTDVIDKIGCHPDSANRLDVEFKADDAEAARIYVIIDEPNG
jgi:hypothetical protein